MWKNGLVKNRKYLVEQNEKKDQFIKRFSLFLENLPFTLIISTSCALTAKCTWNKI